MARQKESGSPDMTQISISIPQRIVERIDEMARDDGRNRSNFIANIMKLLAEGKLVRVQEKQG